jgi:cullin 1
MATTTAIIPFDEGWSKILPYLDRLISLLKTGFQDDRPFNPKSYMEVYTSVYNMCTQRQPHNWSERLYDRHGRVFKEYLRGTALPEMEKSDAQSLLLQLNRHWGNHTIMNNWMKKFFTYLDRFYVLHHTLPSLDAVGTESFRAELYEKIKGRVTTEVLGQVLEDRSGKKVDSSLLKSVVAVFEAMGMGSLNVYQTDFEEPFLKTTREYYKARGSEWASSDDTPSFLIKAEQALESEVKRVNNYLIGMTESKVLKVLEEELLQEHQLALLNKEGSGCHALLDNQKHEHLSRMFRLFSRLHEGLVPMANCVKEHIEVKGLGIVSDRENSIRESGKDSTSDHLFVQELIHMHAKFNAVVVQQFNSNPLFQKAMKDAFEVFVNRDVGKHTNAEMLASYCDGFLKTGGERMTEKQVEEELGKVVQLFGYLQDKDLFEEIYRNLLAKRLLNDRSASDDAEKSMISKLKLRCGAQFTQKMEGMISDLAIGKDHLEKFRKADADAKKKKDDPKAPPTSPLGDSFSVQVLTTGFWPTYVTMDMTLSKSMQSCIDAFQAYYQADSNHRKLKWVYSLGSSNVRMSIKGATKTSNYELVVSTLQAAALHLFHESEEALSFEDVAVSLNLKTGADIALATSIVKKILHSLSCGKYKVLVKMPAGKTIRETDSFAVNSKFKSKQTRIRIPMASLEHSHNAKKIDEDRTHTIEAAIVRIMKTRKEMQHTLLVSEVVQQLIFFKPAPKAVKRCIETLIDREYLERHETLVGHYRYLA